ncbi:GNAT family N-acetyltransferase [bacterium]|nr:GNAT family N-acetyltransferase [bacterium]
MDGLQIRALEKRDAETIVKIHASITNVDDLATITKLVEDQSNKAENVSFVAEYNGSVIGYMISYTIYIGFGLNTSAWITMMEVDPAYMGQGIGRKLAEEIFKVYKERGIKDVYSSVTWDSTDLLSFFKTLGFEKSNFINLIKRL